MDVTRADILRQVIAQARRRAMAFPGSVSGDALPWAVVEAFDAEIRGHVERDRVLIAAVGLAETRPEDEPAAIEAARAHLHDAIDYLEQAVLRFGIVNRRGAQRGLGEPGQRVTVKP